MNFNNRNAIKLLMIIYFNGALVANGGTRKTMIIHVTLYRKLSVLVMSLAGHTCVSVKNKIFLIRRESEAISLACLFSDFVLIIARNSEL